MIELISEHMVYDARSYIICRAGFLFPGGEPISYCSMAARLRKAYIRLTPRRGIWPLRPPKSEL